MFSHWLSACSCTGWGRKGQPYSSYQAQGVQIPNFHKSYCPLTQHQSRTPSVWNQQQYNNVSQRVMPLRSLSLVKMRMSWKFFLVITIGQGSLFHPSLMHSISCRSHSRILQLTLQPFLPLCRKFLTNHSLMSMSSCWLETWLLPQYVNLCYADFSRY